MYLPKAVAFQPPESAEIIEAFLEWLAGVWNQFREPLINLYNWLLEWIVHAVKVTWEWVVHVPGTIDGCLRQNPNLSLFISLLIFLGPWILLVPLILLQALLFAVLYVLGFGLSGIIGGSPAALYQSFCYGGHTPQASLFAMMQSTGASYNRITVDDGVLAFIRLVAGVVGIYVLFGVIMT